MFTDKIKNIIKKHGLADDNASVKIEKLTNSANDTFIAIIQNDKNIHKIFIKMYAPSEGRAVQSCELWVRDILPESLPISTVLASGREEEKEYLITPFIEGITLLEKINQSVLIKADFTVLSKQLIDLIQNCATVNLDGFGSLEQHSTTGQYETLTEFIENNIKNANRLFKQANLDDEDIKAQVEKYSDVLHLFVAENQDYFEAASSTLTPLDLNLNNFIVTDNNQLFMVDLESFSGGDVLLAFGELLGHVYHSPFGHYFMDEYEKFSSKEQQIIHFYALLGNFNVFCFCAAHHIPNLNEVTPWGNPNSFLNLMALNEEEILARNYTPRMKF